MRVSVTNRCATATSAMWWCHPTYDRVSYCAIPSYVLASPKYSSTRWPVQATRARTSKGVPASPLEM
jgi:hypothetical protein